MRARIKKYKLFLGLAGILVLLLSLAFFSEKQKTAQLIKLVEKQDNIVAPYYEKSALQLPDNLKSKNIGQNKIKIPIIMYHYVEYVKDDGDLIRKRLDIVPTLFEGHLQALRKANYETYFVKDIPDIFDGTIHYSTHSAVLTFDDGYEDFYTVVFPLLKKYHVRATIYVIYDYIGRNGFLNEKQIQELAESDLVEIGSHTLDHVYLKLAPDLYAEKQIVDSKRKFEERFGIKIKTFAYPYGAFSNKNIETVQKAGYTAAVSVISGVMQSKENMFYMSRIRPGLFTPQTIIRVIEQINK
ncbi:MAG: polysaccharide deacetylase family protein [bacterium]